MSGYLLGLLLLPLLIPAVSKVVLHQTISWAEMGVHIVIVIIAVSAGYHLSIYSKTADVEILSGTVASKKKVEVSCEHSYRCNCRKSCSGSGSSKSCSTTCDTCYEHLNDYSWRVVGDLGSKKIDKDIDRIDRQGSKEPPRFTAVRIGEPFVTKQHFTNYVKAAPDSLITALAEQSLLKKYEKELNLLPYPSEVYDYYRLDRVLVLGEGLTELKQLNKAMNQRFSELMAKLGPKAKANVVVILTNKPEEFARALAARWIKGKRNDTLLFVGLSSSTEEVPNIEWARVESWSDHKGYQVSLRDDVLALKQFDSEAFNSMLGLIDTHVTQGFKYKNMEDFKYLESEIHPEKSHMLVILILALLLSTGLSYFFHRKEVL